MRRTTRRSPLTRTVARTLAAALAAGTVAASPAGIGIAGSAAAEATAAADAGYEPGELLVTWAPTTTGYSRAAVGDRFGGFRTLDSSELTGVEVVALDAGEDPLAVAAELRTDPRVLSVQPNYRYATAASSAPGVLPQSLALPRSAPPATTNDPDFRELWGLHNTGQQVEGVTGVADVDLDVPEAWSVTAGSPSVVVAVIDSGIDISHEDLARSIWVNAAERDGRPGVDDDGNGYVDDVHGWDFQNDDASVYDSETEDAHGTHVAGIIAAGANNGVGIAGVAPRVRLMPLKFLGATTGTTADAIRAIEYAAAMGATVINASWGAESPDVDHALNDAIEAAGLVFVAAAGNGGGDWTGDDLDRTPWSPANLPAANIVTVAAVDATGRLASFSNYGRTSVDLGAPGVKSVSTYPGDRYGVADGTSMAVPHVAGVAALVASQARGLSAAGIISILERSAAQNPLPALADRTATGGMPNAKTAVHLTAGGAAKPAPTPVGGGNGSARSRTGDRAVPPVTARGLAKACPTLAPAGFRDVTTSNPHRAGIDCSVSWGVFQGGGGGFAPGAKLTRGQLASVLARAIERATGTGLALGRNAFSDDAGSVHAEAIDKLAAIGVVGGIGPGRYGPEAPVTRAQFATMLGRTYAHLAGELPSGPDAFLDDDGNGHEASIDGLAALGIVTGDGRGSYGPGAPLTRGQSATMVARLLDALVEQGAATR